MADEQEPFHWKGFFVKIKSISILMKWCEAHAY